MKRLIIDGYRVAYLVSGAKMFSAAFAVIYITILNFIMLEGLGLLLEGWMPTSIVHKLYAFPFSIITAAALLGINIWLKPPIKTITKEMKKMTDYTFIIVYTIASILVFLYLRYGDKIF